MAYVPMDTGIWLDKDLDKWGKAVGGARCVGDDLHGRAI